MTSFVHRGAERPQHSRFDTQGDSGPYSQSRGDEADGQFEPHARHDPEAKDLLRRYLSEIHSYRELGNHALRELEKRLSVLSADADETQIIAPAQPRARISTPLRARAAPSEAPAAGEADPTLAQRLKELSTYLHADLTRQSAASEVHGEEVADEQPLVRGGIAPGREEGSAPPHRHPAGKPTPSAPVLDRSWFESRFAEMRASIDALAEKIPTQRLDALEVQFEQLMEKLDARESDRSMAAVEAGLKKLAAYLEDNKQWSRDQDQRTRVVEERLDRLSGLVAQSNAALSATAKGLEMIASRTGPEFAEQAAEIVARRTGPELAERTAAIVTEQLAPRFAELDQSEPIIELSGEVAKLSAQSKQYARSTDERLKQLQSCLDESLDRLEAAQDEGATLRSGGPGPRDKDDNPLDEDYDGKMIAAARRAARLADGPARDAIADGEPLRYQIPYGEFLPDEERGNSRLGLIVAAVILLLASVAMLYLNLRGGDGNGVLSQLWPFGGTSAAMPTPIADRLTTGSVKTIAIEPKSSREMKRPASGAMLAAPLPAVREAELTRSDNAAELLIAHKIGQSDGVREAAVAGNADAQFSIGEIYLRGDGVDRVLPVEERMSRAARWFRRAAEKGHAASQYRLGTLYELGQGMDKDAAEAARWYALAAEAGHVKAMHNLAVLSLANGGNDGGYGTAVHWFTKAAERGLRDSQFNLGVLYERGLGVPKDSAAAHHWFALAASQGDAKAVERRDQLAAQLSPQELKQDERQALSWTASETEERAPEKAPEAPKAAAWPVQSTEKPREKAAAEAAPASWSAQISAMDSIVAEAQRLLARLGYRPGPVDGILGPRTVAAIRAFERRVGWPTSGQITDALVAKIASAAL
jgi:hypothetical protein